MQSCLIAGINKGVWSAGASPGSRINPGHPEPDRVQSSFLHSGAFRPKTWPLGVTGGSVALTIDSSPLKQWEATRYQVTLTGSHSEGRFECLLKICCQAYGGS